MMCALHGSPVNQRDQGTLRRLCRGVHTRGHGVRDSYIDGDNARQTRSLGQCCALIPRQTLRDRGVNEVAGCDRLVSTRSVIAATPVHERGTGVGVRVDRFARTSFNCANGEDFLALCCSGSVSFVQQWQILLPLLSPPAISSTWARQSLAIRRLKMGSRNISMTLVAKTLLRGRRQGASSLVSMSDEAAPPPKTIRRRPRSLSQQSCWLSAEAFRVACPPSMSGASLLLQEWSAVGRVEGWGSSPSSKFSADARPQRFLARQVHLPVTRSVLKFVRAFTLVLCVLLRFTRERLKLDGELRRVGSRLST